MQILKEFRDFISSGNVTDLAVGVTVGNALEHFIRFIVNDTITLLTGFIGKVDFRNYYWVLSGDVPANTPLRKAQDMDGVIVLGIGAFATELINTLILAAVLYVIVRAVNRFRKHEAESPTPQEPPAPPADVALLTEIRDLLRAQAGAHVSASLLQPATAAPAATASPVSLPANPWPPGPRKNAR